MFSLQGLARIVIAVIVLLFLLWLTSIVLAAVGLGGNIATLVYVAVALLWACALFRYLKIDIGPPPS